LKVRPLLAQPAPSAEDAFSRFPTVHCVELEGRLRVDSTRSHAARE
jgi:hypothetical protein